MPRFRLVLLLLLLAAPGLASSQALRTSRAASGCGLHPGGVDAVHPAAAHPIPDSQVASGGRDIRRAWLGSPTDRYAHAALGSRKHAASLHALVATAAGDRELSLRLADDRVFEDRLLRLADLDGDGRDEIIVVEAQAERGAALVVFDIQGPPAAPRLAERARGPHVGSRRALRLLGWSKDGSWRPLAASMPLPAAAERIDPHPDGACVKLEDGRWLMLSYQAKAFSPGAPSR